MFDFDNCPYRVRYGILNSKIIYNYLCPNEIAIRHQNARNGFFNKLENSILKEGIRNPIMCWALEEWPEKENEKYKFYKYYHKEQRFAKHMIPLEFIDKKILLICRTHGGSRLMIAQKHSLEVPCIISDFCNAFPDYETLTSISEISKKFKDQPKEIRLGKLGVLALHLPQVHLNK